MGALGRSSRRYPVAMLAVAASAWLAYAPMLNAYWRHDDFGWQRVAQEWDRGERSLWHGHGGFTPAFNLLYHGLHDLAGADPVPYRITLTTLHALNSLAVAWLTLVVTRSRWASAVAGLAFALHFIHHEAVGWPAAGIHLLATAFAVSSVATYIVARRRGDVRVMVVAVALALGAMLSKEAGIAVIPLLVLTEVALALPRESGERSRTTGILGLSAAVALYAILRLWIGVEQEVVSSEGLYSFGPHILVNLVACVPQMIVPDIGFENYRALVTRLAPGAVEGAVLASRIGVGLLTLGGLYLLVRRGRTVKFAVAWTWLAFLPFALFTYEYARAPRYLYLPSAGLALLAGYAYARLLTRWPKRRKLIVGVAGLMLLANLAPLIFFERNRLRDSSVRRAIATQLPEVVPAPKPGTTIGIIGVPEHLTDLDSIRHVVYEVPVEITRPREQADERPVDILLRFEHGRLSRDTP